MTVPERVVLVDDNGDVIGSDLKSEVHTTDTALHLAFSCYVLDDAGRTLITRRALSKRTWPGVWTNACCGHPAPGEQTGDAVARRLREELGIAAEGIRLAIPDFRYRAVAPDGIVENEICPVFTATVRGVPRPDPNEVAEWSWIPFDALAVAIESAPMVFSPWAVLQVPALRPLTLTGSTSRALR
ncbi:isopentenyl-diphosphate Delta-isomerase [Microbacterium sp. NPDC019599]|uniref:isopentenyl-diphosphate Delta-isomerase n=1 Tax=Microbacterium sp. NPDC019599 TaxID=3154690 RepID=UPI0034037C3B